jgi:hypothetical protein
LIADFNPDAFRAACDVLAIEVIERSACSAEFFTRIERAGFCGKQVCGCTTLAEAGGRVCLQKKVRTIEAAAKLIQLKTCPAGLEVTPDCA